MRNASLTHYEGPYRVFFQKFFLSVPRSQIQLLLHKKNQETRILPKTWLVNAKICLKKLCDYMECSATHYGIPHKVFQKKIWCSKASDLWADNTKNQESPVIPSGWFVNPSREKPTHYRAKVYQKFFWYSKTPDTWSNKKNQESRVILKNLHINSKICLKNGVIIRNSSATHYRGPHKVLSQKKNVFFKAPNLWANTHEKLRESCNF